MERKEVVFFIGIERYEMIDADDYHAIARNCPMRNLEIGESVTDLHKIVQVADELEERITKGQDTAIFGQEISCRLLHFLSMG
jgi:hypothetical protein